MRFPESRVGNHGDRLQTFPLAGKAGLAVVVICWILNWSLPGLRTHLLFFPQWLGYCLVVDSLVQWRKGFSLMSQHPRGYAGLFLLSVPVWWVFEGLNTVTHNWHYLGRDSFSDIAYLFFSSLSFSTVIPAVFSTAELLACLFPIRKFSQPHGLGWGRTTLWALHLVGWAVLSLLLLFPQLFFPFLWLSIFFIIDPLNGLAGNPSLLRELSRGRLNGLIIFGLAPLVCGVFWELWNFYAFPKWVYTIPYLDVLHIFEMPLAGYGGYIPFGWELFAIHQLVTNLPYSLGKVRPNRSQSAGTLSKSISSA